MYTADKLLKDESNIVDLAGFIVVSLIFGSQREKKYFWYTASGFFAGNQFSHWIKRSGNEIPDYGDNAESTSAMCPAEENICDVDEINPFVL